MARVRSISMVAVGCAVSTLGFFSLGGCVRVQRPSHRHATSDAGPAEELDRGGGRVSVADGGAEWGEPLSADGGRGAASEGVPAPQVIAVTPGDKNTGVGRRGDVVVQFSQPMDEDSLKNGGLTVLLGTERVAGRVRVDGNYVSFAPSRSLALAGKYSVHVTSAAKSAAGAPVSSEWRSSFTVRDGAWSRPSVLGTALTERPTSMSFEMDADGNGVLVWVTVSSESGKSTLRAVRYRTDSGWGEPLAFVAPPRAGEPPSLSVRQNGDAALAWITEDSTVNCAWYNSDEDSWAVITEVATGEGEDAIEGVRVAMERSGQGLMGWFQSRQLHTMPIRSNMDWSTNRHPVPITGAVLATPWVAVGPAGQGMLVWGEADESGAIALWYSRYEDESDTEPMSAAARVPGGSLGVAEGQGRHVAIDQDGRGLAVWEKATGENRSEIWTNAFSQDGTWGHGAPLDATGDSRERRHPALAMTPSGGAVAAWVQMSSSSDGLLRTSVRASSYGPDSGWEAPATLAAWPTRSDGAAPTPQVTLDRFGNGFVAWESSSAVPSVDRSRWMLSRYIRGLFMAPSALDAVPAERAFVLATSLNGEAVIVWYGCEPGGECELRFETFQ